MALVPYIIVVAVFAVCKLGIPTLLASTDIKIPFPGLAGNVLNAAGADPGTTYTLNLLSNPGTMLFIAAVLTTIVYALFTNKGMFKITLGSSFKQLGQTFVAMRFSSLTIVLVLGLAYIMNFSGQTISIGQFLASTGAVFALLSPMLGCWHCRYWFGHLCKRFVLQLAVRSCAVQCFLSSCNARLVLGF